MLTFKHQKDILIICYLVLALQDQMTCTWYALFLVEFKMNQKTIRTLNMYISIDSCMVGCKRQAGEFRIMLFC